MLAWLEDAYLQVEMEQIQSSMGGEKLSGPALMRIALLLHETSPALRPSGKLRNSPLAQRRQVVRGKCDDREENA